MKVSFNKSNTQQNENSQPVTELVETPVDGVKVESITGGLPVPAASQAVSTDVFGGDDSIDFRDIQIPKIHIGHGVGDIGRDFGPGSIVLNQEVLLSKQPEKDKPKTPVKVYLLGKQPTVFVERVQGGGLGNICRTEAEVVACGGTLAFKEAEATKKSWYQRSATFFMLLEQPEGTPAESFPYEFGGKRFALVQWAFKGGAYNGAAKTFLTARKMFGLRQSWAAHSWNITVDFEKYMTGNGAYAPNPKKGDPAPEGFDKFVQSILSCEA